MTNFERFINENADHAAVVRLVKLSNRMAMNGNLAKAYIEVERLADAAYA